MGFFTADINERLHNGAKTFDIANALGCTVADVARAAHSAGYRIGASGVLSHGSPGTPLEDGRALTPPRRTRVPAEGGPSQDTNTGGRAPMQSHPTPTPPPTVQPRNHRSLGELLLAVNELSRHKDTRVKRQAERSLTQVRKLVDVLETYEQRTAARAEVDRLERELREAKAQLNGKPASSNGHAHGASAADMREWLRANGHEPNMVGHLKREYVQIYEEAHA